MAISLTDRQRHLLSAAGYVLRGSSVYRARDGKLERLCAAEVRRALSWIPFSISR